MRKNRKLLRDCLKLIKINSKETVLKCFSALFSEQQQLHEKTLDMGDDWYQP